MQSLKDKSCQLLMCFRFLVAILERELFGTSTHEDSDDRWYLHALVAFSQTRQENTAVYFSGFGVQL